MDSSDSDDAWAEVSEYTEKYELHGVGLMKPVLDDIFKEVQASIPALNFDESAETSTDEEDVALFSRSRSGVPCPKTPSQEVKSPDSGLGELNNGHPASNSTLSDHDQVNGEEDLVSPEKTPAVISPYQSASHSATSSVSTTGSHPNPSPDSDTDQVKLNFNELELIDFDHLLKRFNDVSVSAGTPQFAFDVSDSDSDVEAEARDSSLMRELESLHKKQLEVAAPAPTSSKPAQTNQLVMTTLGVASKGVSVHLDPPNSTSRVPAVEDISENRETVYLDLRKQSDKDNEQKKNHVFPCSIQRILRINQDKRSSSSSDEDDDDDVASWQQHRQRVKEGLSQPGNRGTKSETGPQKPQEYHQGPAPRKKASVKSVYKDEICERNVKNMPVPTSMMNLVNSTVDSEKLTKKSGSVSKGTSTATLDLTIVGQDPVMAKIETFLVEHQDPLSDGTLSNFSVDPGQEINVIKKATEMLTAEEVCPPHDSSECDTSACGNKTERHTETSDEPKELLDVSAKKRTEKKHGSSHSLEEPRKKEKKKERDCSAGFGTKAVEGDARKREEASKAFEGDAKALEGDARKREKPSKALKEDARKREEPSKALEEDARKREKHASKALEEDARKREEPSKALEGDAKAFEGDARKREEASKALEGDAARKREEASNPLEGDANKHEEASKALETRKCDEASKALEGHTKKREQASKALEAQEKAKRARLRKSLENLRPPLSSGGHQPAAPATPVIFDQEASYEQSFDLLPLDVPGKPCLLLCAKLVSCGELANLRGSPKGGLGSDTHCFSALVAWLLCLVPPPDDAGFKNMSVLCDVPFHVIGLQQKWHEGQLSVDVAIRSRYDTTQLKPAHNQSVKHNTKAGNSFKQTVTKFLSTNSLQSMFYKISSLNSIRSQYLCSVPISQRNLSTLLSVNPDPDAMSRVFGTRPGFFWQTMELEDFDCGVRSILSSGPEIQNMSMVMRYDVHHAPFCCLDVMTRAWREGLDIAGLRLIYTNTSESNRVDLHSDTTPGVQMEPLLVLAIRGPSAVSAWLDVVGPQDASLARLTDPSSLRALYGENAKEDRLFSCPRTCSKAAVELARWFGGRVPENGVINVGSSNHVLPSGDKVKPGNKARPSSDSLITSSLHSTTPRPPCLLTATVNSLVFLVLSPLVPVKCLGYVLSVCYNRGFVVQGIRRMQLNSRRVAGLGLGPDQLAVFCPTNNNSDSSSSSGRSSPTLNADKRTVFNCDVKSPLHTHSASTVLLLSKENGLHHVYSLTEVLATDLKGFSLFHPSVPSQLCFFAVPYSDMTLKHLGGVLSYTPDMSIYSTSLWRHAFYSNPELEQVCVLTLLRDKATVCAGAILEHLLLEKPLVHVNTVNGHGEHYCAFELLGLKLMGSLSMHQAKEFSPCEIGDLSWHGSLEVLTKGPALVCAIRGIDAFERLSKFILFYVDPRRGTACPDVFMSSTPELAYRQLSVLFHERELFSDTTNRTNTHVLPPPRRPAATSENAGRKQQGGKNTLCHNEVSVMQSLLLGPRPLATVCVIKPDAIPKHMGKILRSLSQEGFSVVAAKMAFLSRQQALNTIPASVLSLKMQAVDAVEEHVRHAMSGPSLVLCLMRENAIAKLLEVLGPSDPHTARKQSQFLLRGCYGVNSVCNALYGSEKYDDAVRDVKLFFPEGLCCQATVDFMAEGVTCSSHDEIFNATATRSLTEVGDETTEKASSGSVVELPSSLLEVNCVLLTPSVLRTQDGQATKSMKGFAEVMEGFSSVGFQSVGLRMILLREDQAEECVKLFVDSLPGKWSPHLLVKELVRGPCVVFAVVRSGAVTCFDSLLTSSPAKTASLARKHRNHFLVGKTIKQARRMVECFFDQLMPNNKVTLVSI